MTAFNFGDIKEKSSVNSSNYLKPWGIYEVKFEGLELNTIKGSKDPSKEYHTIKRSFSGAEGNFNDNMFIPNSDTDAERMTHTSSNGHEYQSPSRFEEFKWSLLQLAQVINPEGYEKLKTQSSKIRTMDDFIKVVMNVVNAKIGTTTKLKLTGRNSDGRVYAQIPRVCAINKEGECFICNNYVGENVSFTAYEARQADAYNNSAPTDMNTITTQQTVSSGGSEDELDFDSLLA